ncbi:protein REVEILLE 6-like [Ipomoea triloba]|uniref:protein REVEILLE 6-like n=1 Tax=Ipomoea triloba TaxID=35885 RepID=UPI00125D1FBF|nr:protein REVEILLE 6-like [Ipomoea triloba]
MVSVYPNVPPSPEFFYHFAGDPTKTGLPALHSNQPVTVMNTSAVPASENSNSVGLLPEDSNKKVRKPYTITKSRESWTEQEHDKFLEALQLFDRDWKKIEAFVGSKTVIQIRSHAQKYFLKVQKSGASEHVPPPRPKRKASHPYPQKAPKSGPPSSLLEPGYVIRPDSLSVPANSIGNAVLSHWSYSNVPGFSISHVTKDDIQLLGTAMSKNCSSSSNESTPRIWRTNRTNRTSNQGKEKQNKQRAMPDFAQVYSYIGSVFDPNSSDHLQRLKQMDPINIETALMLMKNLSVNLISPEFEDHRRLLLSNNLGADKLSQVLS